jgi:Xaa-Pro dipeptidase
MDINAIQSYLVEHELDGWLLADFHGRNEIALNLLQLEGMLTRRSFYFIPDRGQPTALVNIIEKTRFKDAPGKLIVYSGYKQLESELEKLLVRKKKVAMEYSPGGRLPYIGLVDAGTIELVRSMEIEVVSSADLVASFQARLSPEQIASHRIAARNLIEIKEMAFGYIRDALGSKETISEYDVCLFIREQFKKFNMNADVGPNCSVDANAGDPHYEPAPGSSATVAMGQLILIDLWARIDGENSIYGDITWMAFAGTSEEIPKKYTEMFSVLVRARDEAVSYLRENLGKRPVYGSEVDDVCRTVVKSAGYGEYFTHRTGHSITISEHGPGPNIDNLETEDGRKLQQGHLFSIEPGIYMADCGFRTEIDVLVSHEGCEVTTLPLQSEILPLF